MKKQLNLIHLIARLIVLIVFYPCWRKRNTRINYFYSKSIRANPKQFRNNEQLIAWRNN
jgi:hypothetical protein